MKRKTSVQYTATNAECRLQPHPCPVPVVFKESTADVLRWVLHVPLQQPWAHISKSERHIYSLIFPTDFFFQAFLKTICLICITPPYTDFPPDIIIFLSLLFIQTPTGLTKQTCTYTHVYTHTVHRDTDAQRFPTATSRARRAHPASGRHTQHPPGRAEGHNGIGRCATVHTRGVRCSTRHTSLHLCPQHTHIHTAVSEPFPRTNLWC